MHSASMNGTNIIEEIVAKRRIDLAKFGWTYGCAVPQERKRGKPVPFIDRKGVILEVKRASPSKGDIAPDLNAAQTAVSYAAAGARAISVLTEKNYFKGSLDDLLAVSESVPSDVAVLRKDFLIAPEEVDIAYRCGADAVLIIARMLDEETMSSMIARCAELEMTAFVELRLEEDILKTAIATKNVPGCRIVCGVNARDLKDFSIDLLTPVKMLGEIYKILEQDTNVVFESGIRTAEAAQFAGRLGFTGMLLGEAAARNPSQAGQLVSAFINANANASSYMWLTYTERLKKKGNKPMLKICGLTNIADANAAVRAQADFLGFIFCKKSPRNCDADVVRNFRIQLEALLQDGKEIPFLVGVITDCESEESKAAIALAKDGIIDFLQLHGEKAVDQFFADKSLACLPHYCVVNVASDADLQKVEKLRHMGEPRVLIDAKIGNKIGGTGERIADSLVKKICTKTKLWLAGGITPENTRQLTENFVPELLDVSSGVEKAPGKKDKEKLLKLASELKLL